ncbi:P-loop containing nucleoside triphosphate hydrolase protein [Mycena floridula]|nr:P-loop containing nucleoside triphosphate hydrolase protein [Mycena floridula]
MTTPETDYENSDYERLRASSYAQLESARLKATKKSQYNSAATRADLQQHFTAKFGKPAHSWQIDVVEAIYLGLDCILAAGTEASSDCDTTEGLAGGSATAIPRSGIKAGRVNGDTWARKKTRENVRGNRYQAIFAGPEMWLKNASFRKTLRQSDFIKNTSAIIIDEAHCISQWGGDFRKAYAELDKLRALFPPGTPVLAASATLNKTALRDVRSTLAIDSESCFHLNLGNDRVNIASEVHRMHGTKDFDALDAQLNMHPTDPSRIKKTLVFTNTVKLCQSLPRQLKEKYSELPEGTIDFLHAYRSRRDKRKVLKRFRQGKIRVLFATESVGMGTDIPDIEVVIHFGVPDSLTVFLQRMGRAGHLSTLQARVILLVEESMFKRRKKKKKKKGPKKLGTADSDEDEPAVVHANERALVGNGRDVEEELQDDDIAVRSDSEDSEDSDEEDAVSKAKEAVQEDLMNDDKYEWGKRVEPVLRLWITTAECPRDISDAHYGNPPRSSEYSSLPVDLYQADVFTEPTGLCCDRPKCKYVLVPSVSVDVPANISPPQTPVQNTIELSSAHSTPSKSTNANGKRVMTQTRGQGPATRGKAHLKEAKEVLQQWRSKTAREVYPDSSLGAEVILPDSILGKLATHARWKTPEDLIPLEWMLAPLHSTDVLEVLKTLDDRYSELHKQELADRKAERQAKSAEEKRLKLAEPQTRSQPHRPNSSRQANQNTPVPVMYSPAPLMHPPVIYSTPQPYRRWDAMDSLFTPRFSAPVQDIYNLALTPSFIPSTPTPASLLGRPFIFL